jgi:glucose/arabinose dehydrogenase
MSADQERLMRRVWLGVAVVAIAGAVAGCRTTPALVANDGQREIDRRVVECPTGFELRPYMRNLTAPTAIAFDADRSVIIAEGGIGGTDVRIFGYKADGRRFDIYPTGKKIPLFGSGFEIRGPVGGIVADQGRVYVSHRDESDRGVVTAFGYDGTHKTVVADLPAQGTHAVTDLAINPANGRLYFGVGSATNSGVVGIDDWDIGWVRDHLDFCDQSAVDLKLLGYRFDTINPTGGIFGGADLAVTAPFQPFAWSKKLRVPRARDEKPTAAVYSVNLAGGGLRVEAHGVRNPVGLQFNEFGRLFMTNQGMELRGSRPVKDDPDALLWLVPGAWYGWPDFSADLHPVVEQRFQPPAEMIVRSGYPELSFLVDHATSGLIRPDRGTLLRGAFPAMSGAAKLDFARASGAFAPFQGQAVVALSGDRAPFANGGQRLASPVGYKVVRVDVETRQVWDFVKNTEGVPASRLGEGVEALERPVDVKFGPDGALWIVDMGQVETRRGKANVTRGTGRIFRLVAAGEAKVE